ncbi:tRNA (adenine-N(1))-methyltransferase [Jeotgalibacillus sp. S-D1]|uniref:tRNA (adenine(22)-N(1))-methyltransferase n=1 Tax=Jeotgalibacillus sp. S-D1 TaxID=2552189 RepID=UPI001059D855|nr:tRNA (adenine(22)-N(1))-methyltransferase TrmK [Jeotgalibacillus sp. S-D1]TDL34520.1 tRNA (adenine-N(1))-methyltransferase [Jeotgalibacillus sp. S-D1]
MNSYQLSDRLHTVASFVPKGSSIADIGSDHAYLPCYLGHQLQIDKAVAGEVAEGPFQSAKRQVKEDSLEHLIEVRKGSGLEVIEAGEVDVITIAGMGGPLIAQILEEGKDRLPGVKRLILQPNINAISIRDWFSLNGWTITDEAILEEDGKIYEVLVAEPETDRMEMTFQDRLLGPVLSKEKSHVFQKKWKQEYNQWEKILNQIERAGDTSHLKDKKKELLEKMKLVSEVLNWEKR